MSFDKGAMQSPSGLRVLIEAVHGVTALEVPDALKGTVIETMGRQMSEAQQAFNQVVDAEDECDQLQMQRVFDDGLRRPGLPRSRLFPAHAGMNRAPVRGRPAVAARRSRARRAPGPADDTPPDQAPGR